MKRPVALLLIAALLTGCGTYRITYRFPSRAEMAEQTPVRLPHAHGIGILGGGGYFFALSQMFPAWIDYTGPVSIPKDCPAGVYQVSQHFGFGWNALAALISWVVIVNAYHRSEVELFCLKPPAPVAPVQPTS